MTPVIEEENFHQRNVSVGEETAYLSLLLHLTPVSNTIPYSYIEHKSRNILPASFFEPQMSIIGVSSRFLLNYDVHDFFYQTQLHLCVDK